MPPEYKVGGLAFDQWAPQVLCNWCGSGQKCNAPATVVGVLPEGHAWISRFTSGEPNPYMPLCSVCLPAWQKHTASTVTISPNQLFRQLARTLPSGSHYKAK